jgi:threonine aldolase
MNFASDNTAPVAPAILDAMVKANAGFVRGYGNDDWTRTVERRLAEVFAHEVAVFLVPTGTAANALALAQVTPPWGVVFCHADSHIATDECGAPEFFGAGLKLAGLPGADGKIAPETLKAALAGYGGHSPHQMVASALSITQASEAGTIYRPGEIATLSDIAHGRGLAVHMDGARFANALARLQCSPADLAWRAGIDILSFGATKNGGALCDAIVVFSPELADGLAVQLRRAGQVWSKMRFASAQLMAYIENGLWLRLAAASNRAAARIAAGIDGVAGLRLVAPVEANEIFLELPAGAMDALEAEGFQFYRRSATLARLVCRFDVTDAEADALVASLRRHSHVPAKAAE